MWKLSISGRDKQKYRMVVLERSTKELGMVWIIYAPRTQGRGSCGELGCSGKRSNWKMEQREGQTWVWWRLYSPHSNFPWGILNWHWNGWWYFYQPLSFLWIFFPEVKSSGFIGDESILCGFSLGSVVPPGEGPAVAIRSLLRVIYFTSSLWYSFHPPKMGLSAEQRWRRSCEVRQVWQGFHFMTNWQCLEIS